MAESNDVLQAPPQSFKILSMSASNTLGAVLYAIDLHRVAKFYSKVLELPITELDDTHVRFAAQTFELVVLQMPADIAATMLPAAPSARRSNTAIKLVFHVANLNEVRETAAEWGGVVNAAETEWHFHGNTVCDGSDPEGNVIQFRAPDAAIKS